MKGVFYFIAFLVLAAPAYGQVVVVANASVPADSVDKNLLLRLFTGDIEKWENGLPVVILDLAAKGAVRESFYAYLGKTSSRMRSIWLKRKLTGEGELPKSLDTESELLDAITSTNGAIGFVSKDSLSQYPGVKVLIASIPFLE